MRTPMRYFAVFTVLLPAAAYAGGYGHAGYGPYYDRYDRYCDAGYGPRYSDYRRLQRSYDRLARRLATQTKNCEASSRQQQIAYQQMIDQHRGLNEDLLTQQDTTGELVEDLAEAKGVPAELLERPTREEFDDLQERYDALIRAYRNLERDYRAAVEGR